MTHHTLNIDEPFLIVLIGTAGSGKSSFTKRHFMDTEVISSDHYRKVISDKDTEYDEQSTTDSRHICSQLIQMRLSRGLSVVVDATNTNPKVRKEYLDYAKKYHVTPYALVFLLPLEECLQRNALRACRTVQETHLRTMYKQVEQASTTIATEGFQSVLLFTSQEEINNAQLQRPESNKDMGLQYDFVCDVHSSLANLISILRSLGYVVIHDVTSESYYVSHPQGRKIVFLPEVVGDPKKNPKINHFVTTLVRSGRANLLK